MFYRSTLIALLASSAFLYAGPTSAADEGEPCKGTLEIGGKTYTLKYAVAYSVKVFDDVGTSVIFAEQPIPVEKLRAALRDSKGSADNFFFFKPHVTVTFDKAGKVMFCNAYADNNSAGIGGSRLSGELASKDGRSTGRTALAVDEESTRKTAFSVPAFDLKTLVVPAAAAEPPVEGEKPGKSPAKEKDADPAPAATADAILYKKLPLPDDATDVEYKKLVGQITCNSPSDHKTVARALTKKLADQGWKTKGSDLNGPKAAILKRNRGAAELTIFVKPAEGGSTVMIMSEGLSWEE